VTAKSFWPPAEATQVDYEKLRAELRGARPARRGLRADPSVLATGHQFSSTPPPPCIQRRSARCTAKIAIYARVSTDRQAERGTIGSQLAALRDRVSAAGHELISEFIDDRHSGARLNRPALTGCGVPPRLLCSKPLVPVAEPVGPGLRLIGPRAGRVGPFRCGGISPMRRACQVFCVRQWQWS
jgi:hypothetical protein